MQFFPDIVPFGGTRYRAHEAADLMGTEISRVSLDESGKQTPPTLSLTTSHSLTLLITAGTLYTSPFNYHSFLSSTLEPFTSWPDMYGNGDTSTQVLRYNLTDPLVTLSTRFGDGITMTGTLTRSNFTTPPFPPENLIVLTDGLCGSTCHLFIDFMTVQAGVRTIALGGRPAYGPMQPVGGTKGANVLTADYLTSFAEYVISGFASGSEQTKEWAGILPSPFPIQTFETTVNFLDSVREGEDVVVPSQFTNETANCRLWYSADMVQDVTEVWRVVADAAWGGPDGGMDEARCVPGSFKRETLLEEPPQTVQGGGDASGAEEGASNGPGGTSGSENRNSAGPLDVRWTTLLLAVVLGAATSTFIFAS